MALTEEQISYLTASKTRILSSTLTDEEHQFRQKFLKMKQKEDRLRAKVIERKIYFDSDYVPQDFAYCDWSSDEEFREWLHSDRIIRKDILDEVLSDDDWLWKLALKYYPDNPEIVYADSVDGGVNWKREKLPKKKQYKQDEA
jgi:isopentenyl phosphate kinase